MRINDIPPYNPTFGYKTIVKTLWLRGELPTVKRDVYGLPLTKKTITNEHLIPHCISHDNSLRNIVLANRYLNNFRGAKPLKDFLTWGQVKAYYSQFKGIKLKNFDGDKYIKEGLETCRRIGLKGDEL